MMSGLALLALSACSAPLNSPRPAQRAAAPPIAPEVTPPSKRSQELRSYYATIQQSLLSQGLLRTDGGGPDTPFNKRQLVENFIQIATYSEFTPTTFGLVNSRSESSVRRWEQPVRMSLVFGDGVPKDQRAGDRSFIAAYGGRLGQITGVPVSLTAERANFHVVVLTVDDLEAFGPTLQQLFPGLSDIEAAKVLDWERDEYCKIFIDDDAEHKISKAVAFVRAEHAPLLRKSCFHEEIAQGFGLSNDSPPARPSIFNDDNEFALLTRHDELLLKILYDKRLPRGSDPRQARPVVEVIASELLGGES